ncbi:dTDP-4-amino-4,6-dideoxyglucose formyltransferase [Sulfurimonas sp. ST-25]|uniref:dTDP-4-amino-4,6-dideoxyglucose formyltransferase n=1 Tax=Sulfurimonas sp. ST-25 TaxID=3400151 RepID=UPI003A873E70
MKKDVMIFTDNPVLYHSFREIVSEQMLEEKYTFTYACTPNNVLFNEEGDVEPLRIKAVVGDLTARYDVIVSCHSKQIFPSELVNGVRCINIHPGLNPYNRGWFPQVFSILNKLPAGVTIHEMDEAIDHGPIILQEQVAIEQSDTSLSAYERVVATEVRLLKAHLPMLLEGSYETRLPSEEGNYNSIQDFRALCALDLEEQGTMGEFLDRLRALSHGDYWNSYFIDEDGAKVWIKLQMKKEDPTA